jgi:hypothetical protein
MTVDAHPAGPEAGTAAPALLTGGCLCGAVRYELAAPVSAIVACFCADCGSPIFTRHADDTAQLILKVGSLDRQDGMALAASIWTASAAPWAHIDRDQPCYPAGRPAPGAAPAPGRG